MQHRYFSFISLLFLTLFLSSCSLKSIALRSTTDLLEYGTPAFYEEYDLPLAESALTSHLKLLEVLLKNDPQNYKLNLLAAQGFGAYAFLFLEDKDPERAKIFYERGRNHGLEILKKKLKLDLLNESDLDKVQIQLKKISKKEIPILFWTAYCWGGLANLNRDKAQSLADLPKIEKMMTAVDRATPDYFYGGSALFFGSYYGSRPKIFGGDLGKSKFYFEKALKSSGSKFLMGAVLYARYYAIPAQNKELFKSLLEQVITFNEADFKEQRLSNVIAKKRAKQLLEDMNEYF